MIPRLFPNETIVCIGDGPSLTREDVNYCKDKAKIIAINYSIQLAPWADIWYGYHTSQMLSYFDRNKTNAKIYSCEKDNFVDWPNIPSSGNYGLELDPRYIRGGHNSGYQAINVAYHLAGPKSKIILLGYDCKSNDGTINWQGHKVQPKFEVYEFDLWLKCFETLVKPLKEQEVEVINCTRDSALNCFLKLSLEQALN